MAKFFFINLYFEAEIMKTSFRLAKLRSGVIEPDFDPASGMNCNDEQYLRRLER